MFGIGANELIIILIFGFIIFGPDKLPEMAKTVGQFIARFRNAQAEMNRVIKTEVYDPDAEDPFKNPLDAISRIEKSATKEDRGESFTERKARYDKQRAAKKAAEERKAQVEARKAAEKEAKEAALEAGQTEEEAKAAAKEAGESAVAAVAEAQAAAKEAEGAKKITAAELYGTKPQAKKPAPKKTAKDAAADVADAAASEDSTAGRMAEGTDAATGSVATDSGAETVGPAAEESVSGSAGETLAAVDDSSAVADADNAGEGV